MVTISREIKVTILHTTINKVSTFFFLLKTKYLDMIRKIVCNFRSKHFSRAPMSQRFYVIIRSKEKCVEMLQYFKDSTGAQLLSTNLICVRKK